MNHTYCWPRTGTREVANTRNWRGCGYCQPAGNASPPIGILSAKRALQHTFTLASDCANANILSGLGISHLRAELATHRTRSRKWRLRAGLSACSLFIIWLVRQHGCEPLLDHGHILPLTVGVVLDLISVDLPRAEIPEGANGDRAGKGGRGFAIAAMLFW